MTDSEMVIDDHPTRPSTITLEKWKESKDQMEHSSDRTWPYHGMSPHAMKLRTSVLNKFWRDHISVKHGRRGDVPPYVRRPFAAVPKSTFSHAMAVMDKVEGWKEEQWVGSFLAASMWMYTKAALCDGRKCDPPLDLRSILAIIIESVSWVTEALRHRSAMPSSVGFAVVFSTDKPEPQVREQRDESGQIQGHSQQCNRVNM